jgi:cation:H+ antiporter
MVLFAGAVLYLGGQLLQARRHADSTQEADAVEEMMEDMGDVDKSYGVLVALLTMGCVGLYFGSEAFISGAQDIALSWGISTHVVGVTVVAFGTSVPEIVASLTAALRGNGALSIGNLVGSNILNIFLVLGATATAGRIEASPVVPEHDIWWMLGAALLLAPMVWLGKGQIGRIAGGLYVAIYAAYVWLVMVHG